ncbi:MAG: lysophospholipid acyltransferase family protein [Planctomycetota bacterium]
MTPGVWIPVSIGVLAWLALVGVAWWITSCRIRGDDLRGGFFVRVMQLMARFQHRVTYEGLEHVPTRVGDDWSTVGEPLIVACNHTAGIDPLLVQAAITFEPRWMMAADMRAPALEWFWRFAGIIFVDREETGSEPLRTAIKHLKANRVIGIFPEAHIERPEKRLLPFKDGIGMMIRRTGAKVLPVVIEGTPQVDPAYASLWRTSRARVRFLPLVDYADREMKPAEITRDLERVFIEATGWPIADESPRLVDGWWAFPLLPGQDEADRYRISLGGDS